MLINNIFPSLINKNRFENDLSQNVDNSSDNNNLWTITIKSINSEMKKARRPYG